ncbi:MAG: HDIG domain-containing protein [Planctomycetaceae bacterium]|nr:HDIG domain-containing protein [Planctomycetaceae bacterium]
MALFQSRKTRTSRAAEIKPTTSLVRRSVSSLHNRAIAARIALCFAAIVATVVVVQGWKVPFPYRLGDRSENGVIAKIEFERPNPAATELARLEAENNVPAFFIKENDTFDSLIARFRIGLSNIAAASTLADLPTQSRIAFGLVTPESNPRTPGSASSPPTEMSKEFQDLREAVVGPMGMAGNRIDDLVSDFERFISPLRKTGLADPAEMERLKIPREQRVNILIAGSDKVSLLAVPDEIQLPALLSETGLLGKAWREYPRLDPIRTQLERWLMSQATVSLRYDSTATQNARLEAREKTQPVTIRYNAGNVLQPAGKPIDEESLAVLAAEYEAVERTVTTDQRAARLLTVFVMLCVLAAVNGYYVVHNEPRLVRSAGRLSIYLACLVGTIALGRFLSYDPWRAEVIPLVATAMVFAVAYNQVLATLMGFTLALIVTISTGDDLAQFIVLMSAVATAVISLSSVASRSTIIKVGFGTGIAYFLVACGLGIVQSQSTYEVWKDSTLIVSALRGGGWCLVAGYLIAGSLPFIEKTFGVVTDISLLEMSDISHPLLQELVRRAPGTYNHSIAVATIGETAADRIGANGLLVRVGAYYHDIGKMLKPQYFIENMTEGMTSRHESLAPAMSTLIIIGHVKDGVDLARRHNLPQPLVDFIEQHHGTTLVEYFFREAKNLADQTPDHKRDVEESAFRYPGPKPQTRELGVMMIADAVESASRTLAEPTPKRIEGLVHAIIMKRLLDGQFDECNLTLNELRIIEESLTKSLIGIYHGRIKYPEQQRSA